MGSYYKFDRLNSDRVLSFYSQKPMDFGGAALEGEGRRKLIEEIERDFGYRFRCVAKCTRQVHGDGIIIVDEDRLSQAAGLTDAGRAAGVPAGQPLAGREEEDSLPTDPVFVGEADGLLTDLPGVALEIHTADCQSVFLYDPVRGVAGNVHSGWKGTAQKIVPKAVSLMRGHYGCRPEEIEVYINPSILGCCFEIEEDVVDRFRAIVDVTKYCRKDRIVNGRQKYYMDTAAVNRDLLIGMGVLPEHVFLSGVCTMCSVPAYHSCVDASSAGTNKSLKKTRFARLPKMQDSLCEHLYHSYRGDHHKTGRNGSMICLK